MGYEGEGESMCWREEMDGESKVEQPVHKRRREQPANVDESDSDDESASLEVR